MKSLVKAAIISFAVISVTGIAGAQQLAPQKVLTDLSPEQINQINGLGAISGSEATTSPVYDFHLKTILTPEQMRAYNQLKDGKRHSSTHFNYKFNIDSH